MNISHDVDQPMGNAELRLTLASIENEIGDVKSIAMETRQGQKYTNGKVRWLIKLAWLSMGALPLLTVWAAWLTKVQLERGLAAEPVQAEQIQAAVLDALEQYEAESTE